MTAWSEGGHLGAGGVAAVLTASAGANLLSLALPLAILQLYDRIIPAAAVETLVVLLAGVAVALALEALLTFVGASLIAWAGARHDHALGTRMFDRLMAADPLALRLHGAGLHAERFAAVARVREVGAGQGLAVLADVPFALLFVGLILVIGGWVAAIPLAVVAVVALALAWHDRAHARDQRRVCDLRIRQQSFVLEALGRIGTIKATALEAPMTRRFERLLRGATLAEHDAARAAVAGQVLQASLGGTSMVAVAAGGSLGVIAGHITVGELAACTLLANRALQPLQRALGLWSGFRAQALSRRIVAEGLAMPGARPPGAPALPRLRGAIALQRVTLAGDRDGPVLLDGIDLDIAAGETVAITGPAGSGKSSLLLVMAGMRCPDLGQVRLDGRHDPWRHTEDSLLAQVAYVPARATILAGTLMQNMTGFAPGPGDRDAPGPRRDRPRALDLAARLGLTEVAGRLPDGFNTAVGPGSAHVLPQGVAQRVALVRALHADPRIVLFDAANTALDSTADGRMRALLQDQHGHRTLVIVSQRPSLLAIADRVFTLDAGRLHPAPAPGRGPQP